MKPLNLQTEERLEELLRGAAAWKPDTLAPEGLAAKALERVGNQRVSHRPRWRSPFALLLTAGAAPAVAAGVMAVALRAPVTSQSPPHLAPAAQVRPVQEALAKPEPGPEQEPEKAPIWEPERPSVGNQHRFASAGARRDRRSGTSRRHRPSGILAGRPSAPPSVSPWSEETVERTVSRVVASGWLVEPNPEDGTWTAIPAVASISVCGPAEPDPDQPPSDGAPPKNSQSERVLPAEPQAGAPQPSGAPTPKSDTPNPNQEKNP